jgi:hypothetical protein
VQCFFEAPVPETGTVPVVANAVTEQRKNSKKRKLGESSTPEVAYRSQQQIASHDVHHDGPGRGTSFPATLSEVAHYSPGQLARVSEGIAGHHSPSQHQQRNRDSLLVMNTSAGTPAQTDQAADDGGSDATDEAEIQGMSRMLDDGKGRMRMYALKCTKPGHCN